MQLYVSIYTLDGGKNTLAGVISFEDNKVRAEPTPGNESLLQRIVMESVEDLSVPPEQWMRSLHRQFSSPYLRATQPSHLKPAIGDGVANPSKTPPTGDSAAIPPEPVSTPQV